MAWLYEKSPAWRRLVAETKGRPWVLAGFTAACCGVAVALGAATMAATNNTAKEERLRQELERKASSNSQLLSKVNNERLHEYLQEIHRKENNDDRYQAAIRGYTATGTKDNRVFKPGTSMRPLPDRPSTPPPAQQQQQQQELKAS